MAITPPPPQNAPIMAGHLFSRIWSGWFRNLYNILNPGISATVPLAKLTTGGAAGSMIFVNGILIKVTDPS